MDEIRTASFPLGQVVATRGALGAMRAAGQGPEAFLGRHAAGDWGDVPLEDARANVRGLRDGERILSSYATGLGVRLWVITEADRASTCILLPDEY